MPFGMIGSIVGAGLGFLGQKKTNKTNERLTRETNAQNAELSREHNAAQLAFSEKQNAQQLQLAKHAMHLNTPTGIRQEAEKAGFNPNVFAGSTGAFGHGYSPQLSSPSLSVPHMQTAQMGNEYAQLGVGIADAFSGYEQLQIQRAELDMERQRLEHLQKAVTLGADVPGIYGARNASSKGTSARVSGGVSANRDGSGAGLGSTSGVAPGREIEIAPFTSGAGLTEINSGLTGHKSILVPGDDGEPWGLDELVTAVLAGIPQIAPEGANKLVDYWDEQSGKKDKKAYDAPSKTKNHIGHIAPAGMQGAPISPIWTTDLPPAPKRNSRKDHLRPW